MPSSGTNRPHRVPPPARSERADSPSIGHSRRPRPDSCPFSETRSSAAHPRRTSALALPLRSSDRSHPAAHSTARSRSTPRPSTTRTRSRASLSSRSRSAAPASHLALAPRETPSKVHRLLALVEAAVTVRVDLLGAGLTKDRRTRGALEGAAVAVDVGDLLAGLARRYERRARDRLALVLAAV